jgi:hypothetical protein
VEKTTSFTKAVHISQLMIPEITILGYRDRNLPNPRGSIVNSLTTFILLANQLTVKKTIPVVSFLSELWFLSSALGQVM